MSSVLSPALSSVLTFVWENQYSSFYRDHWQRVRGRTFTPQTVSTLEDIPLLTREDLMRCIHPSERLFIPLSQVSMLRSTSGTSGKGALHVWREYFPHRMYHSLVRHGARRAMVFNTYHYLMSSVVAGRAAKLEIVGGDPHDLKRAARIARDLSVDTLILTPTVALVFAEYLRPLRSLETIRHILLWGEYVSEATNEVITELFPQALRYHYYASAEANDTVLFSEPSCQEGYRALHTFPEDFLYEVIEEELVITSLRLPHAMPLIRYTTGDTVMWTHEPCVCGNRAPRLVFLGRKEGDFVRVGGGEVRLEEVEKVMVNFRAMLAPLFVVSVSERRDDQKRRMVSLTVRITKRDGISIPDSTLASHLLSAFLKELRLSPTMRLEDAVRAGLFEVPNIIFVPPSEIKVKNPRIELEKVRESP